MNRLNNKFYKKNNFDKIKIATIMSIYINTEKEELKRAIKSLENQRKINFDLLIHLDGRVKPEVYNFINKYKPKGKIINLKISFTEICKGLAASMNYLILNNFNNYEYFARHDSDDYSSRERFITQINFLKENTHIDIVGSAFSSFNSLDNGLMYDSYFPNNHNEIAKKFSYSTPIAHATVLFRKSFFLKAGLYNPNLQTLTEDSRLWYSGFYNNCIFANIPKILYFVSFNPKSYSRRSNLRQIIVIYKIRLRYIFSNKLGLVPFIQAFIEFLLRIGLAVFVNLKLNFITGKLIKYYQKSRSIN